MWRLYVDTGGTFTDCLALNPQGELHRAKVLSSSTLRARVQALPAADRLELTGEFPRSPDFLAGFHLRRLGSSESIEVLAQGGHCVRLAAQPGQVSVGDTIELLAQEEAPLLAARIVTGTPRSSPLPTMQLRLATTRGTNAMLESKFAHAALLVTRGFGDVLRIGTQQRPELFAHPVVLKPPVLDTVGSNSMSESTPPAGS
jgi:5-oxoprolinase (ATP-hydrolysing)